MSIEYYHYSVYFDYPAIAQLALSRLDTAINNYFENNQRQQAYSLSLSYRTGEYREVVYVSNVAFVFSKFLNIPPLEIARDFATFYVQFHAPNQDFIITVVPPGFLQLKLTELKLAKWLQQLPFLPLSLASFTPPRYSNPLGNNTDLFAIQYAHARCYSLMKLAQKEGLITLERIPANNIKLMFPDLYFAEREDSMLVANHPQPFPWLNCREQLQFSHSAEYCLIIQLVKVVDALYDSTNANLDYWAKIALSLAQAFANFYSHCRIFDGTNTQMPKLAQARLGLILATSLVLNLLLQRLGVFAPQEL